MTGKEWDHYFKNISMETKTNLRKALVTLDADPMFKKAFGSDFRELIALIDCPLPRGLEGGNL